MVDNPSRSGNGDSTNRPANIDLLRTLKTGDLVPVKPPSKFLEKMRKNLLPEADQANEGIRSNKREAPFKFFEAHKSLKQVCDDLYSVKSEYDDFCKSQTFLDRTIIRSLPNKQAKWKKLLAKIEQLSSNPNFDEGRASTFAKKQMEEMNKAINSMNNAKDTLGLSALSKNNLKTMENYKHTINSYIDICDIDLAELKEKIMEGLIKIQKVEEAKEKTSQVITDLKPRLEQIFAYYTWSQKGDSSKQGAIVDSKPKELKKLIRQLTLDSYEVKELRDQTNQDLEGNTIIIGTLLKNSEQLAIADEKLSQGLEDIEGQLDTGIQAYSKKIEGQKSKILKDLTELPVIKQGLKHLMDKLVDKADTLLNQIRKGKSVSATDPLASLQQRTDQFDNLAAICKQFEKAKKLINEYRRARSQLKQATETMHLNYDPFLTYSVWCKKVNRDQVKIEGIEPELLIAKSEKYIKEGGVTTTELLNQVNKLKDCNKQLVKLYSSIEGQLIENAKSRIKDIKDQKSKILEDLTASPISQQDLVNSVNELAGDTDRLLETIDQAIKEMSALAPNPLASLPKLTNHLDNLDAKSQELGEKSQELKDCLEAIQAYDILKKFYHILTIKINNNSDFKKLTQAKEDASKAIKSVPGHHLSKTLAVSIEELKNMKDIDQQMLNKLGTYRGTWGKFIEFSEKTIQNLEEKIRNIELLRNDFREALNVIKEKKEEITQIHSRYFGLANDINTLHNLINQRAQTGDVSEEASKVSETIEKHWEIWNTFSRNISQAELYLANHQEQTCNGLIRNNDELVASQPLVEEAQDMAQRIIEYLHKSPKPQLDAYEVKFRQHWREIAKSRAKSEWNRELTGWELEDYTDRYLEKLDQKARDLLKDKDIWMRRQLWKLPEILADRRLKSQFETKTVGHLQARGKLDNQREREWALFGYHRQELPDSLHFLSGYPTEDTNGTYKMADGQPNDRIEGYGSVALHLKKEEVGPRSTVTGMSHPEFSGSLFSIFLMLEPE